jgi:hypothetical protein
LRKPAGQRAIFKWSRVAQAAGLLLKGVVCNEACIIHVEKVFHDVLCLVVMCGIVMMPSCPSLNNVFSHK